MPSKLSLVFYQSHISVPGKNGLCHRICHFILINSFRGARSRQICLHPRAARFAVPDLLIDLQASAWERSNHVPSVETSSAREGLSCNMYCRHHLLHTFPCRDVLDALPTFCPHYLLMREKVFGVFRLTFHYACIVCFLKALCSQVLLREPLMFSL